MLFDRVQIEPTDASFKEAIAFAVGEQVDAFVAVGGGSTIDTAKAANLYATYPADFLDYVNAPIGKGLPVPGPLKPLIAIPTTAGTGSETTGTAIFDLVSMHAKTGISHRNLKPTLGIIDPENTATLSPTAVASTGCDVLSHALESYTAIAYTMRPYPERPILRPAYQGANPVSDLWARETLAMVAQYLPRAMADPEDREAREKMLLAASFAGIGFGNAGVHLPHGMSYPVAGMVRDYHPTGYAGDHPIVPHGMAVILNAPAVFRFTGAAGRRAIFRQPGCSARTSAGRNRRRGNNPLRPPYRSYARITGPEWSQRHWLHLSRHSGARGRHTAAASRHQALAASGRGGRSGAPLRGCNALLVVRLC